MPQQANNIPVALGEVPVEMKKKGLQFPTNWLNTHLWHVAQFEARCKPIYRPNDPWVEGANLLSLLIEQHNRGQKKQQHQKKTLSAHQPPTTKQPVAI